MAIVNGKWQSIDYDFAANVTVFAAKISQLIFNDFAANLKTNSRLFHFFPNFEKVAISRLNLTISRLIITKFAAILYKFAALFYDLASNIY